VGAGIMEYPIKFFTNDLIDKLVVDSKNNLNSLSLVIPISYALKCARLNWNDVFWGFYNEYFDNESIIEFAKYIIDYYSNEKVFELVCLSPDKITREYLLNDILYSLIDKSTMNEAKDKILYIVLSFIFENINSFEDPLRAIEVINADFNYPETMRDFVGFTLKDDYLLTSEAAESEYIFNNLEKYLENCRIKYKQ